MRSFYHNVLALLHFLSVDHQLLDKFQNENKILMYLEAVKMIINNNINLKQNLNKLTCLKRCPSSHLLNEDK